MESQQGYKSIGFMVDPVGAEYGRFFHLGGYPEYIKQRFRKQGTRFVELFIKEEETFKLEPQLKEVGFTD